MKSLLLVVLTFSVLMIAPKCASAQTRTMSFDASTSLLLQEFRAMLTLEDETIKVAMRMGRDEAEAGQDRLEQGDVILMMNGKRATDIEMLRSMYEELPNDEEIKIGVRRGEERFILRAIKGEIPKGAGGFQMVTTMDGDSNGEAPVIVQSLGLLVADVEESVIIQRVIPPMMPDQLKELDIREYTITEFNGEKPENARGLQELADALEVGADISLTLLKDGDEKTIQFKKAEAKGSFSISTGNNR